MQASSGGGPNVPSKPERFIDYRQLLLLLVAASITAGCNPCFLAMNADQRVFLEESDSVITTWEVPEALAPEQWLRAQIWVAHHAVPRISFVNESIIQTEAPNGKYDYGYTVSREPKGSTVRFEVNVVFDSGKVEDLGCPAQRARVNLAILRHFMVTGELRHPEMLTF